MPTQVSNYGITDDHIPYRRDTDDCYEAVMCMCCSAPIIIKYPKSKDSYKGEWPVSQVVCPDCIDQRDWADLWDTTHKAEQRRA